MGIKAKEKAIELIFLNQKMQESVFWYSKYLAKKTALQFVNEILKEIENNFLQRYNSVDRYYYWQEVKEEIENL